MGQWITKLTHVTHPGLLTQDALTHCQIRVNHVTVVDLEITMGHMLWPMTCLTIREVTRDLRDPSEFVDLFNPLPTDPLSDHVTVVAGDAAARLHASVEGDKS